MSAAPAEKGAAEGGAPASLRLSSLPSAGGWAAALPEEEEEEGGGGSSGGEPEPRADSEARRFALCLAPETGEEVKKVEESVEEMLIRLEEFCGMTDMIRSDTSQLLDEAVPLIKAKVMEMNNIYNKVDKLEAFVKMAGHHISFLEEQVLQAEKAHDIFPCTMQKLFGSAAVPSSKKKCSPSPKHMYNLPELYRTEDYFLSSNR